MNKNSQHNLKVELELCKSTKERIYLRKPGNWPSISENASAM